MNTKINLRMIRFSHVIFLVFFGCTVCSKKNNNGDENQQNSQPGKELNDVLKVDTIQSAVHPTPSKADPDSSISKPAPETIYRFIVSFYSIGEGTEQNQIEKLETFLDQYRQKSNKVVPAEKTYWGREGELDFCINLSEIASADQLQFIIDCKKELKTAKWVHFSENLPCRKKRR